MMQVTVTRRPVHVIWLGETTVPNDCCLLNPRVTNKHGDQTAVVELCDRRPGIYVRNPRRTEDPSKTAERYR